MRPRVSSHLSVGTVVTSITDADAQKTLNHKMAKRQRQPNHQLRTRPLPRPSRAGLSKCRLTISTIIRVSLWLPVGWGSPAVHVCGTCVWLRVFVALHWSCARIETTSTSVRTALLHLQDLSLPPCNSFDGKTGVNERPQRMPLLSDQPYLWSWKLSRPRSLLAVCLSGQRQLWGLLTPVSSK